MKIAVLTQNIKKQKEFEKIFANYNIKCDFYPSEHSVEDLCSKYKFVLGEESNIYDEKNEIIDYKSNDKYMTAYNKSNFAVYYLKNGNQLCDTYETKVDGYVVPAKNQKKDVFGWDDIFILAETGLSYHEAFKKGLKISARYINIGYFLKKHILSDKISLNWHQTEMNDLIDFSYSPEKHYKKHDVYFKDTEFKKSYASYLFDKAVNNGVFFRTSESRREKNYWNPGLNGGIPIVPKKDSIHEITFQFHDLMHNLMPDLIFDADKENKTHRDLYILHRMMGEAFSLVAADYLFVKTIHDSGIDYDFNKRRIFPLFNSLELPKGLDDEQKFKLLCFASYRFAVLGDDSVFREYNVDEKALSDFKEKYENFFVEDYRWTAQNYDNMTKNNETFSEWTKNWKDFLLDNGIHSIKSFQDLSKINKTNDFEKKADIIFETCFENFFAKSEKKRKNLLTESEKTSIQLGKSFIKYMSGQANMYFKYKHVPSMLKAENTIFKALNNLAMKIALIEYKSTQNSKDMYLAIKFAKNAGRNDILQKLDNKNNFDDKNINLDITLDEVNGIRNIHSQMVDILYKNNIIGPDENRLFKSVYPIFDPFFVFYDKDKDKKNLREIISEIFQEQNNANIPEIKM